MPIGYLRFVRANARFLLFGALLAFASSFGQTFYIALYGSHIREAFDLGHGSFGSLYSAATLASGLLIMWLGRPIDVMDLRLYATVICLGLALGCLVMGSASGPLTLGAGLFLLRFFGQGLLSHAASTTMARYFDENTRGKAISLASLGHPLGEALLPVAAVALALAFGWRSNWFATAALIALVLVPFGLWLLRGHGARHGAMTERVTRQTSGGGAGIRQWTRREVLGDGRFYLVMAAMLAPSFIITGVFFHQVHLADSKGWELHWFAASFAVYAAMQVLVMAISGPVVDRVGGRRLTAFYLLPMALGLAVLGTVVHPLAAVAFMAAIAVTEGVAATLMSVVWVELYGVLHLGAIRAMVFGFSVIATALSPAAFGWLLDAGIAIDALLLVSAAYSVAAAALLAVLFGRTSRAGGA